MRYAPQRVAVEAGAAAGAAADLRRLGIAPGTAEAAEFAAARRRAVPAAAEAGGGGGCAAAVRLILAGDGVTWIGADPARAFRVGGDTGGPVPVPAAEAGLLEAGVPARIVAAAAAAAASAASAGGAGGDY